MMDAAELTLDFHYASDLKDVKTFGRMDPYASVWIEGCGEKSTKVRTPRDRNGGRSPQWQYTMKFRIVPVKIDYSLFIEIKHEGKSRDRHIASVKIPFSLLLHPDAPTGKGTYPLFLPSDERKGNIVFSYEFSQLAVTGGYSRGITAIDTYVVRKRDKARRIAFKAAIFGLKRGGYHAAMFLLTGGHSSVLSLAGGAAHLIGY